MKTLLSIILVFSLMSCGIISLPTFDSVEYGELVQIVVESKQGTCAPAQIERLSSISTHVATYSAYLPNNELTANAVSLLDSSIQELVSHTNMTETYCTMKLRVINRMATELAKGSGGKVR